jgi:hypothetical protein
MQVAEEEEALLLQFLQVVLEDQVVEVQVTLVQDQLIVVAVVVEEAALTQEEMEDLV